MGASRRPLTAVIGLSVLLMPVGCGGQEVGDTDLAVSSPLKGAVLDGLTEVARPRLGASDPTYLPNNHRFAVTARGRSLVVFGSHADGVQLAWRDELQGWRTASRGETRDGELLDNTGTGDWPTSIAVASGSSGEEYAWVVWGRTGLANPVPLGLRRLSELDHPDGPLVGPLIDLTTSAGANPDLIAVDQGEETEIVVSWLRQTEPGRHRLVVAPLVDPFGDTPTLGELTVLEDDTSAQASSTLVAVDGTVAAALRGRDGTVEVAFRDDGDWSTVSGGVHAHPSGQPTAVGMDDGSVLVAAEAVPPPDAGPPNTGNTEPGAWIDTARDGIESTVVVERFDPGADEPVETLRISGYAQPTLATDGERAWLIAIRETDGLVVSRQLLPGSGWTSKDTVEVDDRGGGNHAWPNALREVRGRLRFVVEGPSDAVGRSSVLAYQREV